MLRRARARHRLGTSDAATRRRVAVVLTVAGALCVLSAVTIVVVAGYDAVRQAEIDSVTEHYGRGAGQGVGSLVDVAARQAWHGVVWRASLWAIIAAAMLALTPSLRHARRWAGRALTAGTLLMYLLAGLEIHSHVLLSAKIVGLVAVAALSAAVAVN